MLVTPTNYSQNSVSYSDQFFFADCHADCETALESVMICHTFRYQSVNSFEQFHGCEGLESQELFFWVPTGEGTAYGT